MKDLQRYSRTLLLSLILAIGLLFSACAQVPTGVLATDGNYPDKIIIIWDQANGAAYYQVFRSDYTEGPYEPLDDPASKNITGIFYQDESVDPDVYYYYKVKAFSSYGFGSGFSEYDRGYAGNTNALFLQECLDAEKIALDKLDPYIPGYPDPGPMVCDVIIYGDISGTCDYHREWYWFLLGRKIEIAYDNYEDIDTELIFNTPIDTPITITLNNSNGNGSESGLVYKGMTGTIYFSGGYTGYVEYHLEITDYERSGGYYIVSQDGLPEQTIDWYPPQEEEIVNAEFLEAGNAAVDYAIDKLYAIEPDPNIGTDVTIDGDIGGTCHWTIVLQGLGGLVTFDYTDYNDSGIVINGTQSGTLNLSANGNMVGTLYFTGDYSGSIEYHLVITGGETSGGYYIVSWDEGIEGEKINWTPE